MEKGFDFAVGLAKIATNFMAHKLALIYPPSCDPTAPYLAIPMLTGFLRSHGRTVIPIDANIEAWDDLLTPDRLQAVADRLERRLAELEQRKSLSHREQLQYGSLWRARGDAAAVPSGILEAKAILRDPVRFFDPLSYGAAVATIEAAQRAISAAYGPLQVDFTSYRTPFSLLTMADVQADAEQRDPFAEYVEQTLVPRLVEEKIDVVGLSACFPGQLQIAYAFAYRLKAALPHLHITAGGPGFTQLFIRLKGARLRYALGPLDSAVVFEGEHTLLRLLESLDAGSPLRDVPNLVLRDEAGGASYQSGHGMEDLRALPAPDFDGLPLSRYLSPQLVLPYDPTRGCYWGRCTFCHYGLAEVGTAAYRERTVEAAVSHLSALSHKYGTRYFYLSQDSVAPKTLLKFAEALVDHDPPLRWATDLKPERYLTQERAEVLRRGGAVACALGVESAAPRVLKLIDKGQPIDVVRDVIDRLADSSIAVEAMCFTDFPTETRDEALSTLRFLQEEQDDVALFIVGRFGLTHGARVAQEPSSFGLSEVFSLEGDELATGLFFTEKKRAKRPHDHARVDAALDEVSAAYWLRHYPWAGALSTAHTILYYDRFGRDVFRKLAAEGIPRDGAGILGKRALSADAAFSLDSLDEAEEREQQIWQQLIYEKRKVSRALYEELCADAPVVHSDPQRYRYVAGQTPVLDRRRRGPQLGRRPAPHVPGAYK